ncbi:MAG: lysostaphin resistance A-like protein [Limisphaerales bacterium]
MRLVLSLIAYFVVVFIGGALLAPGLYWGTQWGSHHWPLLTRLAAHPFHRFLGRSLLGLAVLGLWPLLRFGGMAKWRDLGFVKQKQMGMDFLRGLAIGWASLAAAALLACIFGARAWAPPASVAEVMRPLFSATLTALLVAVLEEILFRGALFGLLRKAVSWPAALAASSAIYSLSHFIARTEWKQPVDWSSGLTLLGEMIRHHPPLVPAFFTLFVAGAILALAYERSGALFLPIGLHAGWIFWLKISGVFFHQTGVGQAVWGSDNIIHGWAPLLILLFVLALMARRMGYLHADGPPQRNRAMKPGSVDARSERR